MPLPLRARRASGGNALYAGSCAGSDSKVRNLATRQGNAQFMPISFSSPREQSDPVVTKVLLFFLLPGSPAEQAPDHRCTF